MEKTDKIKQRVLQFAKNQHLVMGDFYKKISVHPSTFSGKGLQSSLSGDIIAEILTMYPELSADWLLLDSRTPAMATCQSRHPPNCFSSSPASSRP